MEKKASQAVRDARGIVAASTREMVEGTLKQIFSSAMVYSLYPPSPLISPIDGQSVGHDRYMGI